MKTVVDSSAALAVILPDKDDSLPNLFRTGDPGDLIAPELLRLEITNALLSNVRRRRLTEDEARTVLHAASLLPIATTNPGSIGAVFELGRLHGLSAYDATYLQLALDSSARLATLDERLRAAATAVGIPTVP